MIWQHTPEAVLQYAREGRLEDWIDAYLTEDPYNPNPGLAQGLKLQKRWWFGPVHLPISALQRCCGPEPHMEYIEPEANWNRRLTALQGAMRGGWQPAPVIAQHLPGGTLSIRDGNHRLGALEREGHTHAWGVIWSDTQALHDRLNSLYCR